MMNIRKCRLLALPLLAMLMKSKHPVDIVEFGVITNKGDVKSPYLLTRRQIQLKGLHQVLRGDLSCLYRDGGCRKTYVWQPGSMPSHTNTRIHFSQLKKFCYNIIAKTKLSNTPLILSCRMQLNKRSIKFHVRPNMNWRQW